ncbi:MAG: hypothetical protein M9909_08880 [Thermomicrobiales bacterium]|nr:hypothetical protein [Thermomicrobiales bacterium]
MTGSTTKLSSAIFTFVTSMMPMIPTSTSTLLMMPITVSPKSSWITATSFWMRVITAPTPRLSI